MQVEQIYAFLRAVTQNNNREWFAEHKADYLAAKAMFEEMTQAAINRIATFDPSVRHLSVADCTYRFHRDTRFSGDKSPYKRHFGCYISAHGKKGHHGGYYLHLEPDNSMVAGGSWCPPSDILRAVRQSIVDEIDTFRAIMEEPHFAASFPTIGMSHLKGAPKGFPKDFPYLDYIRCKEYTVECSVADSFYEASDWLDQVEEKCRIMKPFLDFVNYTIDEYE